MAFMKNQHTDTDDFLQWLKMIGIEDTSNFRNMGRFQGIQVAAFYFGLTAEGIDKETAALLSGHFLRVQFGKPYEPPKD